jgi:hypothetical protein
MKTNRIINKFSLLTFLMVALSICKVRAQEQDQVTLCDRLFSGGSFGLIVGTVTDIEVEPLFGYRITPRWSAGVLAKYGFYKSSDPYYGTYSTSIFGAGAFTDFVFFKNFPSEGLSIVGHSEVQSLSLENKYFNTNSVINGRFIETTVFLGGGLRQKVGAKSSANIYVLWPVASNGSSPYSTVTLKLTFIFAICNN